MRNFFVRYFSNIKSDGLVLSGKFTRILTRPNLRIIYWFWIFIDLSIMFVPFEWIRLLSASLSLILSRYFFVYLRYSSINRGNGAPGFMSYWSVFYAFIFLVFICTGQNSSSIEALFKFDFALIMISAGIYKSLNGYLNRQGIEYGLINPIWSIFPKFWFRFSANSNLFVVLNFLSIATEILIAVFLIFKFTTWISGVLLIITFLFLFGTVRLGALPLTMIVIGVVMITMDPSIRDTFHNVESQPPTFVNLICYLYGMLLVASFSWNWLYKFNKLPKGLTRKILEGSYRITGSIIWSVFSKSLTKNYFEHIDGNSQINMDIKTHLNYQSPVSDKGVHNGITVTTLLTFLGYFPRLHDEHNFRMEMYLKSQNYKYILHTFEIIKKSDKWTLQNLEVIEKSTD